MMHTILFYAYVKVYYTTQNIQYYKIYNTIKYYCGIYDNGLFQLMTCNVDVAF